MVRSLPAEPTGCPQFLSLRPHSQFSQYLLQPVQGVVQLPPAVQRQQPHLLPLADQQVDLRVLGLEGRLAGRLVQGLRGRALPCTENQERIATREGTLSR